MLRSGQDEPGVIRVVTVMQLTQTAIFVVRPIFSYRAIELGANDAFIGLLVVAYALLPAFIGDWLGACLVTADLHQSCRLGSSRSRSPQFFLLQCHMPCRSTPRFGTARFWSSRSHLRESVAGSEADDQCLYGRDLDVMSAAASLGQMGGPLTGRDSSEVRLTARME